MYQVRRRLDFIYIGKYWCHDTRLEKQKFIGNKTSKNIYREYKFLKKKKLF